MTVESASDEDLITRLFSLRGRVALVTGGTSGIGRMIAAALLQAGAAVHIVGRKPDACAAVAEELSVYGDCRPLPGSVATPEGCESIGRAFALASPRLDILVNAAGVTWAAPLENHPDAAWDKVMDTNLKGMFQLTVALLPALAAAGSAADPSRVINIGSIFGLMVPDLETYAYSASKAGVHHLTRHLAKVLGPRHILVNAIALGAFPTRMMAATIAAQGDTLNAASPTGRIGEPDDMAGVAIYLASRASANVTGAVIPVDGGYATTR